MSSNSNSLSHNFARDRISSGEIGDLISDAMQDTPPSATHKGKGKRRKEEWNGSFGPPRAVAVQDMGESLVMDFDSDSDDDGFMPPRHDGGRGTQSGGCVQPSGRTTGKQADLEHEDIFSDNDDDFCIVDTPTTTKVVCVCVYVCVNILAHSVGCVHMYQDLSKGGQLYWYLGKTLSYLWNGT